MNTRHIIQLIAILLLGLLPGAARAAGTAPLQPAEIRLHVATPAYTLDAQGVRVEGYAANAEPGAPALPVWRTVVALPPTGEWRLTFTSTGGQTLRAPAVLPAAPVPALEYSGPGPVTARPDLPEHVQLVDRPDPAIYATDAFYPAAPVVAGEEQWQRGRRLLAVTVFPFQYNPVRGELRYHPDLDITAAVTDASGAASDTAAVTDASGAAGDTAAVTDASGAAGDTAAVTDASGAAGDTAAEKITEHPERSRGRGPGAVEGCEADSYPRPHPSTGHYSFSILACRPAQDACTCAAQPALRLYTAQRGLHRLTYADLVAAGVPADTLTPGALAMSYLGEPIAIDVTGAADGRFDPGDLVIFYAEPYAGRYMTHNVYRFTWGGEPGLRVAARDAAPTSSLAPTSVITQTARVEYNRLYYSEYDLPADHDRFFDNPLYVFAPPGLPTASVTYTLPLDDVVTEGAVRLAAALHGGKEQAADPDQSVAIYLNGHAAGVYQWKGRVLHALTTTLPAAWLDATTNQVTLEAALAQLPDLTTYWVNPDWVALSYPALADAEEDRLYIEGLYIEEPPALTYRLYLPLVMEGGGGAAAGRARQVAATGFTAPDVRIYDVRDPQHPVRLTGARATPDGATYTVQFGDSLAVMGSYALAAEAGLLAPSSIAPDAPSAWRTPDRAADYIAVVHPLLWDAIQPLLDHRAAEGLRVAKVDVQDIYDEFSGGRVDPEAIRQFLAYAYHHWNPDQAPPTYVLLVGDGHYDFKNARGTNLPNLIPPYLLNIDPWIGETAADNRFVSADSPEDYLPDMAIGRIPARNPADVTAVVDKILAYETAAAAGPWQSRITFVADDYANAAGNFHELSDDVRLSFVPADYDTPRLYYRLDETLDTAAEMRSAIRGAFNEGALLLQWFGHASRTRWGAGSVDMFNTTDVPELAANTVWPFTASYACWSGYFINMSTSGGYGSVQTLAEQLLLTPGRGSLADFSPSGQHLGWDLLILDRGLTKALLQDRQPRVGLAVDAAKLYFYANSGWAHDVIDTQILFGDPATRLRLP